MLLTEYNQTQDMRAGHSDAVLRGVATRMQQLSSARGEPELYCGDIVSAAVRLGAKRLVLAGPGAHRLAMRSVLSSPVLYVMAVGLI